VKNEEANLNETIKSVAQQTIKPTVWAIFDDCSTDGTPKIIIEAKKKHDWILYNKLNQLHQRDLGLHLAKLINEGFEYLEEYCKINEIEYEYLANLDGDLTLENTFFEKLINGLEANPALGIVSGSTQYMVNNELVTADVDLGEPSGGHMLIKKKCFEDIGGIMIAYSWDSVLKAKAKLQGWDTKRINEAKVIEFRDANSADGYWAGYVFQGKSAYYRDLNPLHVFGKGATYSLKKPYYIGLAYLYGYFMDCLKRKEKINDEELKNYYRNKFKLILEKRRK
jgi:glycosyltransferase involved in cell wall biosynthesis